MFEIAWQITNHDDYDSSCCYEIAATHQTALWRGAWALDTDVEYCTVKRAPQFDEYASLGYVPPEVLIRDCGWKYECWHCNAKVAYDCGFVTEDEDYEYQRIEPVFVGQVVYCSQQCCDARRAEVAKAKKMKEEAVAAALLKFPDIRIKDSWTYNEQSCIEFCFPGGKHSVRWFHGDNFVSVCLIDVEAWGNYKQSMQAAGGGHDSVI